MTDHQIHTVGTLSALYRLDTSDIEKIIEHYGMPCFSCEEDAFLIYVPLFEACVRYDTVKHLRVKQHLRPEDYQIKVEDMVLVVSSTKQYPSSFLLLENFAELLRQHTDISDETAMLLTYSATAPLFFGHRKIIERLADDFDRADVVASVNNFVEWRGYDV